MNLSRYVLSPYPPNLIGPGLPSFSAAGSVHCCVIYKYNQPFISKCTVSFKYGCSDNEISSNVDDFKASNLWIKTFPAITWYKQKMSHFMVRRIQ